MTQMMALLTAMDLWKEMSIETRTAFVKWLAADSSVRLYTQVEIDKAVEIERQFKATFPTSSAAHGAKANG